MLLLFCLYTYCCWPDVLLTRCVVAVLMLLLIGCCRRLPLPFGGLLSNPAAVSFMKDSVKPEPPPPLQTPLPPTLQSPPPTPIVHYCIYPTSLLVWGPCSACALFKKHLSWIIILCQTFFVAKGHNKNYQFIVKVVYAYSSSNIVKIIFATVHLLHMYRDSNHLLPRCLRWNSWTVIWQKTPVFCWWISQKTILFSDSLKIPTKKSGK